MLTWRVRPTRPIYRSLRDGRQCRSMPEGWPMMPLKIYQQELYGCGILPIICVNLNSLCFRKCGFKEYSWKAYNILTYSTRQWDDFLTRIYSMPAINSLSLTKLSNSLGRFFLILDSGVDSNFTPPAPQTAREHFWWARHWAWTFVSAFCIGLHWILGRDRLYRVMGRRLIHALCLYLL